MAPAQGHAAFVMRVDHHVVRPSQPASRLWQGQRAMARGHRVVVMRVDHPVVLPKSTGEKAGTGTDDPGSEARSGCDQG